jgi:SAM-dependent methyltransferase
MTYDDDNLALARSNVSVDQINAVFYNKFPYPLQAHKFDYLQDPYFETCLLNQDVGSWNFRVIPKHPKIWVAGCGTNQALITALKFPEATILGTDLSTSSLEICAETAKALGIVNLELKQESINQSTYKEKFDYIVSTGVIHHNAFPEDTLRKLAAAMKPCGILELMVYNRFHWLVPSAFQKAIRILQGDSSLTGFEEALFVAKEIINELEYETSIGIVSEFGNCSDSMLADELIQPVLHSYTIESLADLVGCCNLELILPCLNKFDKIEKKYSWNISFKNPVLREMYNSLPDLRRWQVTNLLLREKSPQLWFYLQRKDSERPRMSEREICEQFLDTRFVRTGTIQKSYLRKEDGKYTLLTTALRFPTILPDEDIRCIADAVDGKRTMREIFQARAVDTSFYSVNHVRIRLATTAFPYVRSSEFDNS